MAKLREKMETRQFLRLVAEARRRYAIDPLFGPARADELVDPDAPQPSEDGDEGIPEPSTPSPCEESA